MLFARFFYFSLYSKTKQTSKKKPFFCICFAFFSRWGFARRRVIVDGIQHHFRSTSYIEEIRMYKSTGFFTTARNSQNKYKSFGFFFIYRHFFFARRRRCLHWCALINNFCARGTCNYYTFFDSIMQTKFRNVFISYQHIKKASPIKNKTSQTGKGIKRWRKVSQIESEIFFLHF